MSKLVDEPLVSKMWFNGDKIHRADGPAIEYDGSKEWWLNDKQLTEKEWKRRVQTGQTKVTPTNENQRLTKKQIMKIREGLLKEGYTENFDNYIGDIFCEECGRVGFDSHFNHCIYR